MQGEGDGEVEGVVGGLVNDDELVLLHGEVVEVDLVLGGGEQIAQLAHLRLQCSLMEELNQVYVGRVRTEKLLEQSVDDALKHEGVVDSNHTNTFLAVPAGLATASDAAVHNVVRDKEESLQELSHPTKSGGMEILVFVEGLVEEERDRVGNRHAAVALSTEGVGLEILTAGSNFY